MVDRPKLRPRPPGPPAPPGPPSTGGAYLGNLIATADTLRIELGFTRWEDLREICNGADPKTLDRGELAQLIVKLRQLKRGA